MNVRLTRDGLQHDGIEHDRVSLTIAPQVFDQQLVDDAALASPAIVVAHVRSSTERPKPHFARSVSAENGAVLHKNDAYTLTRCGDGTTHPRKTASDNYEIGT